MIASEPRVVTIGDSAPTQIRDTTKPPVTFSKYRYASGGGTIEISSDSAFTFGDGEAVDADGDFNDPDQSLTRYMLSSSGNVDVTIVDYFA